MICCCLLRYSGESAIRDDMRSAGARQCEVQVGHGGEGRTERQRPPAVAMSLSSTAESAALLLLPHRPRPPRTVRCSTVWRCGRRSECVAPRGSVRRPHVAPRLVRQCAAAPTVGVSPNRRLGDSAEGGERRGGRRLSPPVEAVRCSEVEWWRFFRHAPLNLSVHRRRFMQARHRQTGGMAVGMVARVVCRRARQWGLPWQGAAPRARNGFCRVRAAMLPARHGRGMAT